jgi:degradative hydroxymethylglutaryl-CoA reductase
MSRELASTGGLDTEKANLMVENCIGKISLPLGLGLNFIVNGKGYNVPMAVEEPSVVAAASSGAKFVAERGGGFRAWSSDSLMVGQVQILEVDSGVAIGKLEAKRAEILSK